MVLLLKVIHKTFSFNGSDNIPYRNLGRVEQHGASVHQVFLEWQVELSVATIIG